MKENLPFFNSTAIHLNVPQSGLIENLWQSLMRIYDSNFLQSLMGGEKTKLLAIADRGVLASYKK